MSGRAKRERGQRGGEEHRHRERERECVCVCVPLQYSHPFFMPLFACLFSTLTVTESAFSVDRGADFPSEIFARQELPVRPRCVYVRVCVCMCVCVCVMYPRARAHTHTHTVSPLFRSTWLSRHAAPARHSLSQTTTNQPQMNWFVSCVGVPVSRVCVRQRERARKKGLQANE